MALKTCQLLSSLYVIDTHKANYYKDPTAKIDVSLSNSEMVRLLSFTITKGVTACKGRFM